MERHLRNVSLGPVLNLFQYYFRGLISKIDSRQKYMETAKQKSKETR